MVEHSRLALGNLDVARDWGHARDFVLAMWLILQQAEAEDFVVGTGEIHTLRDLCAAAYAHVGCDWREHVVSDPGLVRPLETGRTVADPARARERLGWAPRIGFEEMVRGMVDAQIAHLRSAGVRVKPDGYAQDHDV